MKLHKILKDRFFCASNGFTLIEILVVLGLVAIVLMTIPVFDIRSFQKRSVQGDVNNFIQNLQKVRSEAMNNIDVENHSITINGEQIVFERLTGKVTQKHEIVFKNGIDNATVTINYEGGIDW